MSAQLSGSEAVAAGPLVTGPRRRRRSSRSARLIPYLLIGPTVAMIVLILGYPIYKAVTLSFQRYELFELIAGKGTYIGLDNYGSLIEDSVLWHTLVRTIVFTVGCVGSTIGLGMLMALMMARSRTPLRLLLQVALIFAWSMPPVVAVQVWKYIINDQNGVLNHVFTNVLHIGDYTGHDWLATPAWQLTAVASLVVWGALPFVTITLYAGLAQVPEELREAAEIDGARPWRVLWDVVFPVLKPILLILTSLSIIWDFGVFTQAFLLIGPGATNEPNYLMSTYAYVRGFGAQDYGYGSAISLFMLVVVASMSVFYVRQMVRIGEAK